MKKQNVMKSYEKLKFSDDFMFGKVMEDPELCRKVLECLLGRHVGRLSNVQTQREFHFTPDGKPIKLDVYNKDDQGAIYDAEMQNLGHKKVRDLALSKRSRFYQASIDIDIMDKKNSYLMLPDSTIIFICTFDPFGFGSSQYTFTGYCREIAGLELYDGTLKAFFNTTYTGEDISPELRALYDYIEQGKVKGSLTKKINDAVKRGRKNSVWRSQYMKERIILQEMKEEGRQEGRQKEKNSIIRGMLNRNMPLKDIADICRCSVKYVKKVESRMAATDK